MNLYRNILSGEYSGTMAQAKVIGPYIPIDVPVDKAGLIAYLNDNTRKEPDSEPLPEPPQVIIPPTSESKVIDYDMTLREVIKHASIREVADVVRLFMTQYVNESDEDSKYFPNSKVFTMTCEDAKSPDQREDSPRAATAASVVSKPNTRQQVVSDVLSNSQTEEAL